MDAAQLIRRLLSTRRVACPECREKFGDGDLVVSDHAPDLSLVTVEIHCRRCGHEGAGYVEHRMVPASDLVFDTPRTLSAAFAGGTCPQCRTPHDPDGVEFADRDDAIVYVQITCGGCSRRSVGLAEISHWLPGTADPITVAVVQEALRAIAEIGDRPLSDFFDPDAYMPQDA